MGLFCHCLFWICVLFAISDANVVYLRACHGVEYPGLGCFDLLPPFTNSRWLPQSPSFVGTNFKVFTRQNPSNGHVLNPNNRWTIRNAGIDGSKRMTILVHGFLQHANREYLINTTRSLLEYEDMSVIIVGWGGGAGFPYSQAAANTRLVGAQLTRLLLAIFRETGLTPNKVHIVGHSLGAHIAGYTGATIPGIRRITALDPAQPNFHGFGTEVRLDPTDADLVDVIHTDGISFNTVGGYGLVEPTGHIDFYPNGGHNQPGCHDESSILGLVEDAWTHGLTNAESHISCSHERSVHLFAASIDFHSSCSFRAFACESEEKFQNGECTHCGNRPCPIMGFHADRFPTNGVFYLNTTSSDPFCGHHYFVSLMVDQQMHYTQGIVHVQLVGSQGQTDLEEVKSGQINSGEVINKMILSDTNIGEISSVKVKFTFTGTIFDWTSDSRLSLNRIKATNLRRVHPKYFCQRYMIIEDGQELVVSNGSFLESTCTNQ